MMPTSRPYKNRSCPLPPSANQNKPRHPAIIVFITKLKLNFTVDPHYTLTDIAGGGWVLVTFI